MSEAEKIEIAKKWLEEHLNAIRYTEAYRISGDKAPDLARQTAMKSYDELCETVNKLPLSRGRQYLESRYIGNKSVKEIMVEQQISTKLYYSSIRAEMLKLYNFIT